MGATSDLRNQLGDNSVRVRFGGNRKFVTMGDTTVELDASATNEQVAAALNAQTEPAAALLPTVNIATGAINLPSITGFQPGLIKARIDAIKQKAAERRAVSMAKLDASAAKLETVDAAIEQYAAKLEKQADDELQEFAEHTNGGPA